MASMFCRKAILPIPWLSIQPKTDAFMDATGWSRGRRQDRVEEVQMVD
jgi:hypothetical protein